MSKPALIIEDDADIAESVKYNLESEGFSAVVASTGEQGLALALDAHNPPSVIVLDLMLPGMNGMELCRRLRRENQTRRAHTGRSYSSLATKTGRLRQLHRNRGRRRVSFHRLRARNKGRGKFN